MQKLKKKNIVLALLLLTSLTAHVIFGLETDRQVAVLENEIFLNEMNISSLERRNALYEMIFDSMSNKIHEYEQQEADQVQQGKYAGQFEITYYTAGPESTGKYPEHPEYGITASGATVKDGQTIATDWDVLPVGTRVYIEGIGERIVEDKGGLIKGNAIDVYVPNVDVAMQGGRHKADVYILEDRGDEQ